MGWVLLVLAILLEVAGTTCMKLSEGFSKILPSVLMGVFYLLSLAVLNLVLKKIDMSVAYAVWSGLGTALIAAIGILWFREPVTAFKMISIGVIILGVIGLNMSGGLHQ